MKDVVRSTFRRAGAWTSTVAPVGVLAAVLMPLARSGEGFRTVRRLIALWLKQNRDNSHSGAD